MTPKKKTKKVHKHRWMKDLERCLACGAYEAYCANCDTTGLFDGQGKLIDTAI